MRSILLLALCLAPPVALAGDETAPIETAPDEPEEIPDTSPEAAARAEYVRLSSEMKRRAAKDHWDGVEHAYNAALATGSPLSFDDHMFGVNAALSRGDIATARTRLLDAKALRDGDPTVIETLWSIDTAYAAVRLRAAPESTLDIAAMPFNPQQAKAVGFARSELAKTGAFEGYLPAGEYTLVNAPFVVIIREIGAEPLVVEATEPRKKGHGRR